MTDDYVAVLSLVAAGLGVAQLSGLVGPSPSGTREWCCAVLPGRPAVPSAP